MKPRRPFSVDRDAELAAILAYKQGDRRAGEKLLAMHDGLIAVCARRGKRNLEFDDAKQEAKIWFLDCVSRFDPANGAKLSTYAMSCVGRRVTRHAENTDRLIRVPVWAQESNRDSTKVAAAAANRIISLDAPISNDTEDETLHDVLADTAATPEKLTENEERAEKRALFVADILCSLTDRQRYAVTKYYIDGLTLAEIGEAIGCTRENVRLIINNSVILLRRKMNA